jgi:Ca-activated chloride channel family protein
MGRLRNHRPLLIGAALFAAAGAAVLAQSTFKVEVRLVRLLVTVKDRQGQIVGSLDRGAFRVVDSGVPQEIAVFERSTSLPLSVSVLIDTSGSTAKELRYETQSVEKFLRALTGEGNPQDAAALYSFNYDVTLLTSFTRRQARLFDALKALKPEGGTSLYDAIYLASKDLEGRDGRHVLVIVTDGGDTTSRQDYHQALEAAQRADAVIYPILVVPITNPAGRNTGGEHALDTIASGTGGRVFAPSVGAQLDQAFTDILRDLRTQYLLGYYPRNIPVDAPKFHPVKVEVSSPDLRAQTRAGYYETTAAK